MSSGSNQAITYEEVAAYQADQGIAMYATGSGGYTTGGIYVLWTTDGGFTGEGWKTNISNSPTEGMTEEEIQQEITNNGNLNNIFGKWVIEVDYNIRYPWIFNNIAESCRYEVV